MYAGEDPLPFFKTVDGQTYQQEMIIEFIANYQNQFTISSTYYPLTNISGKKTVKYTVPTIGTLKLSANGYVIFENSNGPFSITGYRMYVDNTVVNITWWYSEECPGYTSNMTYYFRILYK